MALVPFYGNAVSGNQRFDRPALQNKLLRTLASSGGVKMFGLRRIGKCRRPTNPWRLSMPRA